LLAKVIASAESRDLARVRLVAALRAFPILGIGTNIPFLLRILEHPRFCAGNVDTTFLDSEGSSLAEPGAGEPPAFVRAAMASADGSADLPAGHLAEPRRSWDPWRQLRDWRS
jgi:acetyl/propionyl-CoA carboxylase alpha subunit